MLTPALDLITTWIVLGRQSDAPEEPCVSSLSHSLRICSSKSKRHLFFAILTHPSIYPSLSRISKTCLTAHYCLMITSKQCARN
ncbi:hypothetical protein CEXT_8791 [Caerostris extrusa]|uniref:Uncharacterized protein n=1 Tax=Caerostris extrusa TaxID=172846 RepID=A0AAV4QS48_CAEEX|nr:hypothetical protein CEXT_8791 [Caerostris extrusa]